MRSLVAQLSLLSGLLAVGCLTPAEGPTPVPPQAVTPLVEPLSEDAEGEWEGLAPRMDRSPGLLDFVDYASKGPDRPFGPIEVDDPGPTHWGLVPRKPARLAVSDTGIVYFSDTQTGALFGYDEDDKVFELGGIDKPMGLEVLGDVLFVGSGEDGSVRRFDLMRERWVGPLGQGPGEFAMPNDMAISPDGSRVYVVDSLDNAVRYYDPAGPRLGQFGARGSSHGQFHFPAAIAVDDTSVYVADQGNHRIEVFDLDGAYQRTIGEALTGSAGSWQDMVGKFSRVQGLALLPNGDLAVLDSMYGHIQLFDPAGKARGYVGGKGGCPTCPDVALDLETHPDGTLYISDPENKRWIRLSVTTRRAP